MVSNDVITMPFYVIVSIIISQRHRKIVHAVFSTSAPTFNDELTSHTDVVRSSLWFVIVGVMVGSASH